MMFLLLHYFAFHLKLNSVIEVGSFLLSLILSCYSVLFPEIMYLLNKYLEVLLHCNSGVF